MTVFLTFLAILGACALGLFIVAVTWAAGRLDRAENAASGFQRDEPYTDQYAREANRWPANDFDPAAGLARLRADIEAARAEDDPTSPARRRPTIPAQRKEGSQ